MKIAQIIPFFAPAWGYGGPVKVCFELSRKLSLLNNKITVLTTDAYDHTRRIDKTCEEMDGIKVLRFRNVSNNLAKKSNLYLPKGFKKYFKQNVKNFDLVHLHAFYTYQNIVAAKYCILNKVPYVLHLHEKFDATSEMGKSGVKKLFLHFFGKKIIQNAKKIFVLSEQEKANLLKYDKGLKDKIEIVPNPAPRFEGKCKNKTALRKKYGLRQNDRVILSLSRLSRFKGIDLLVRAFAILAKKDDRYRLIIAGPDEDGEKLKLEKIIKDSNITDKVIFTGLADEKMKDELFCVSDLFALFSRYESFGIVILESLAHSVPVCLSRNVGLSGVVETGKCGMIIANPCDYRKSALELEGAFASRNKMALHCKAVVEEFSLDKITKKVVLIYKGVFKK